MGQIIALSIMFLVGCYLLISAYKNVSTFYESRKIKRMINLVGLKATRIIYMVIGSILIVFSVILMLTT